MFGNKSVWGWLYPYQGSKKCRALKGKSYVVGKDSSCDVVIPKQQMPSNDDYANLNKQHFKIKRKDNEVFLKDLSSMHTYVNGKELYFNEKIKLKHNDVISVLRHNFKVFVFLDNKKLQAKDYPDVIKNKYAISYSLTGKTPSVTNVVFDKETSNRLVLKKLKNICGDKTAEEIEHLRKLQHPCLMAISDVHSTAEELYVVRRHAEGGNLLFRIYPKKTLTDDDIKLVFYQTALAVQYLHDNCVTHGNLKPENILLLSPDSKSLVKVTDISLSTTRMHASEPANADSPLYTSPEFVSRSNDSKPQSAQADVWALGVILFYSLSGSPPFKHSGKTSSEWTCSFLPSVWSRRSLAKDLVKTMLTPDASERPHVERILSHPWLKADTLRSLAHSLMYPGEKYEPPEEQTPPASPKEVFFEDVIIQRSKPPRHVTEKFGVQVLPVDPVSRKSAPEHVLRRRDKQAEFENRTFQKSFSFREGENVDNSFFRKSWSQRLPAAKPIPPTKPPRQSLEKQTESVTLPAPCESSGPLRHSTPPPVPPAKPLRLFRQVSNVESSEACKFYQDKYTTNNEMRNGDSTMPPKSVGSGSTNVVPAVGPDTHKRSVNTDAFNSSQISGISECLGVGAECSAPRPVPSPRSKVPPMQECSELNYRNAQQCEADSELHEKCSNDVTYKHSSQIKVSDKLLSHGWAAQEVSIASPTVTLAPPQKPVRTYLLDNCTIPTQNKPRKKRLAPQPPPKPQKFQNHS